jgi:hypothetical protein
MPDGAVREGIAFESSAYTVAREISKQLAEKIIVAKVRYPNGRIMTLDDNLSNPEEDASKEGDGWMQYDVTRPFEGDVHLVMF